MFYGKPYGIVAPCPFLVGFNLGGEGLAIAGAVLQ